MKKSIDRYGFDTLAIHAGQDPDPCTLSRGVPVYRTSSYVFRDSKHAADLFSLRELGNIYTRIMNPTTDILEKRIAALEGGVASLALASGTSAVFYAIINILEAGEEFISSRNLYGGTYTMFNDVLPQFGITVRFVDYDDPGQFRAALTDKTRAIFVESIGNPTLGVPDFEAISAIAREAHVPLIVDATFTPPCMFRALDHGADIVVHSLTKWLGGHGAGIGGVVVDSGKFDWTDPKFKLYNLPEPSYGGLRFAHDLGDLQSLAYILRMRLVPLRNLGACISPDNAWIFLQGIETLSLRMERHCANAEQVANHLLNHPKSPMGSLSGPGLRSIISIGSEILCRRQRRRHGGVRRQGRRFRGGTLRESPRAIFALSQCGRRQEPCNTSSEHDAFSAQRGAADGRRGASRPHQAVHRTRGHS